LPIGQTLWSHEHDAVLSLVPPSKVLSLRERYQVYLANDKRRTRLGRNSLLPRLRTTVFQIVKALQPLPQHLDLSAR